MNKQIFVGLLICAIATAAYAACADRKEGEDRDFIDDAKCKLSSASDKVKETFSTAISSDTVQDSYAYVKNKTAGASETIGDAAKKTGSFLSDLGSSIWESTKKNYALAKDAIQGKKENNDGNVEIVTNNPSTVSSI
ncbi:hypothetical protein PVAND_013935 [Polypedilum vanderplanki]|uniref:Lipoprotein n=1 Tax=Polypedilum vanderplanki TaxID=319348 RepID=A0A9J6CR77_POLVA|nr:hypothetical protein PVAND_013935 [Polypedilum vanderplanki]